MVEPLQNLTINFDADEALMYLIQQVTKRPTEEILGFFYDLGMKVAHMGLQNMEGRGIRKDIRDVFPGSCIPFKLLVKGRLRRNYAYPNTPATVTSYTFYGEIIVTFPDKTRRVDQKALMEKIIERSLLNGESLPNFPQPKIKTPRMYKDLMAEVIKKQDLDDDL